MLVIGRDLVGRVFWPPTFGEKCGRAISAMSVLTLIRHGFSYGFGTTLLLVLEYYNKVVAATIGRLHPIVAEWLAGLSSYWGWHVVLYPHWRHIFILMGIYFFRDAGTDFGAGIPVTGVFRLLLGFTIAFVCAVSVGTIPLSNGSLLSPFLIAAIPVLGTYAYDVIDSIWGSTFLRERWALLHHRPKLTWWNDFRDDLISDTRRTVIGLVLLIAILQVPIIQHAVSPGLSALAVLVVLFVFYWLWLGASYVSETRNEGEPWLNAFWRSGEAKLGAAMFGVFLWGGAFIVINTGLSLIGL
jgi:hypothetical protein